MNITIPDEVFQAALRDAVMTAISDLDMEAITLLDVRAAAKLLDVHPNTLRKLPIETVDLGERKTKWSLKAIKEYIASRTVKVCR